MDQTLQWDDPAEAALTWRRAGGPDKPLPQSFALYWDQGWAQAAREKGEPRPVGLTRYVNGYLYRAEQPVKSLGSKRREAMQRAAERRVPGQWREEWLPQLRARWAWLDGLDLGQMDPGELAVLLQENLTWYARCATMHAHTAGTSYDAVNRLVEWYLARFPGAPESEPYELLQGLSNASVEKGHRLWRMSRDLAPADAAILRSRRLKAEWGDLGAGLRRACADYCFEYRENDRARLAAMLLLYADGAVPDPRREVERQAAARAARVAQVRARLDPGEVADFDDMLAVAAANLPLNEDHNYWLDGVDGRILHPLFDEFGRRLAKLGLMRKRGDVAFLRAEELILWGLGRREPLGPRIARRMEEFERQRAWDAPAFLAAPPAQAPAPDEDRYWGPAAPLAAPDRALQGVAASAGVARGRVRVIKDLRQARQLAQGEVLVCPLTDPQWTPLFALACALVTDRGGSLCHGAIVAREYGIPAVVGTHRATRALKTGQWVEVDGRAGTVRVVAGAEG